MQNTVEHSLLGQNTPYPTQYSPDILFAIPREGNRQAYPEIQGVRQGMDWWHAYELSWLDEQGIPQVAMGRLAVPADSPYLIESKSLKLYLNSFNFERLSQAKFVETVEHDLSRVAGATVHLTLLSLNQLPLHTPDGICLDEQRPTVLSNQPDARLLQYVQTAADELVTQSYFSHALRSNCPVTGQPDWGTLFIRYCGKALCESALFAYIISYRQHNGFHEQCVEQIFADIWTTLAPKQLMVYACYTRRGGLDINPCRVSDMAWLPEPIRLARQ